MSKRQYQRVRTVPPDFWTPELRQVFDLWVQDMRCGMRPYTDRTVETFERRFILYTRRGWEGKTDSLGLSAVFKLTNVYSVISEYPIESYSNRHNMLYSLISFAKFLIALGLLEEEVLQRLRKLRPRRVTPARKTVLRQESDITRMRQAIQVKSYESEYSRILDRTIFETFIHTGFRVAELC